MVVVLLDRPNEVMLTQAALSELARLGVASVAVLEDGGAVGVVLEGWAFEPNTAGAALVAVAGPTARGRTLHPVAQLAVSPPRSEGGIR